MRNFRSYIYSDIKKMEKAVKSPVVKQTKFLIRDLLEDKETSPPSIKTTPTRKYSTVNNFDESCSSSAKDFAKQRDEPEIRPQNVPPRTAITPPSSKEDRVVSPRTCVQRPIPELPRIPVNPALLRMVGPLCHNPHVTSLRARYGPQGPAVCSCGVSSYQGHTWTHKCGPLKGLYTGDQFLNVKDSFSVPVPVPFYVRMRDPLSCDGCIRSKKCRRSRTVFTELQLMGLEKRFESQKYLSTPDRLDLAEKFGLTQIQVKTWYQNRRMKWKKQVMQSGGTEPPTKPKGRPRKIIPDTDNDVISVTNDITTERNPGTERNSGM